MLRAAERCEGNYQAIVNRVQRSPWIVPDETGWRIGGWGVWLHVAASQDAVAYLVARERGFEASARLIGEDYAGKLIHDGWASYDRFWRAIHQTCLAHLLRRCHELLETATRGAVVVPRKVQAILQESLETRDQRDAQKITAKAALIAADDLQARLTKLVMPVKTHAANERFCRHLLRHTSHLFTFLRHRGIDATNWRAEQAIRPAVVNRKVWGGNRTEAGAAAQSILMTVLFTALKLKRDGLQFVSRVLCSPRGHRPMLLTSSG
jgi:transposase